MALIDTVSKVSIRKTKGNRHTLVCPWWVDCPCCPASADGFSTHKTHAHALAWAFVHIDERHTAKVYGLNIENRNRV